MRKYSKTLRFAMQRQFIASQSALMDVADLVISLYCNDGIDQEGTDDMAGP